MSTKKKNPDGKEDLEYSGKQSRMTLIWITDFRFSWWFSVFGDSWQKDVFLTFRKTLRMEEASSYFRSSSVAWNLWLLRFDWCTLWSNLRPPPSDTNVSAIHIVWKQRYYADDKNSSTGCLLLMLRKRKMCKPLTWSRGRLPPPPKG